MFLASLLRRIAFSYYDYKAYNFNIEKTDFVVIHIPDQIGDAMAIFPVIRALELHKIKHLLIVTSTINLEVFNALKLEQTKLTLVTMTMQDHATLKNEINSVLCSEHDFVIRYTGFLRTTATSVPAGQVRNSGYALKTLRISLAD